MLRIVEISQVRTEDKVEEAAEGSKDDDKFKDECCKANKTKFESCSNLTKCFLEAEEISLLVIKAFISI